MGWIRQKSQEGLLAAVCWATTKLGIAEHTAKLKITKGRWMKTTLLLKKHYFKGQLKYIPKN